ncbi:MAG: Ig-like domain-containing protein [Acidimicrobiales bacterium]
MLCLCAGGLVGVLVTRAISHRTSPGAAQQGRPSGAHSGATTVAPPALRVLSVVPANGATGVSPTSPITVTLSSPLAKSSALPTVTPTTAGSWQSSGASLSFTPSSDFAPLADIAVTVPGGPNGVTGANGGQLGTTVVEQFQVAYGSVVRIQQLLSLLDYSPLAWTPDGAPIAPNDTAAQLAAAYNPPRGSYAWRDSGWPAGLRAMWEPGVDDVFTRGLIMSFQADHGLVPNGDIQAALWSSLIGALASDVVNTGGYNYALADKAAPESLTIYHDGVVVLHSLANTGIPESPTPDGTFPVDARLRRQIMRGTNPDGRHYADLVQYIAYFKGNDAVHYMDRSDYGIPQSLGCIELPLVDAAKAWPYLAYGTLVTIVN